MMDELSLNILDIAQNSIAADATLVEIEVEESDADDTLIIRVRDDGKGMSEEFVQTVENPFVTTRTTRKVGLGISFMKEAAELTGGSFVIKSKQGAGTLITAEFVKSHIDRQPVGDLTGTMVALITLNPAIDFALQYKVDGNEFAFSTQEAKEILGGDAELNSPVIAAFLDEYIREHLEWLEARG